MSVFTIRLTFHGDLGFFRGSRPGGKIVERTLREKTSVKDVIESCGVPHPEVGLILVDDQPINFAHAVEEDAIVDVYPVRSRPTQFERHRLQTCRITRFVADGHLGKLARNLRLLGFDVAYDHQAQDRQLLGVMESENRALLTRDRRLLMHSIVKAGYCPRSQNPDEHTIEVIRRFDLFTLMLPFTRCLRCNAPLQRVAKADIIAKLEPLTKIYYQEFRRCTDCAQIYWAGSHFEKLQSRIGVIHSLLIGKSDT